jgi:hypothetical protein
MTGQRVTWLGRGYRVVATSATLHEPVACGGPGAPADRRYVHLAPWSALSIPDSRPRLERQEEM